MSVAPSGNLLTPRAPADIVRRMKPGNNATLAAGAIFVIAASIFIGTLEAEPTPVGILNSLELRPALYLSRFVPESLDAPVELDDLKKIAADWLETVAGKPLATRSDRLAGAAAAAAVGARHLVPLFVGCPGETDEAGRVMLRWAFDPGFVPGPAELNSLRTIDTAPAYEELAVTAVMAGSGRTLPETALRLQRWTTLQIVSFLVIIAVPAFLIWGTVLWFRWRKRQFAEVMRERKPLDPAGLRVLIEAYVWFMVLYLSANLLLPRLLAQTDLSHAGHILVTYLVMAAGGLTIAYQVGRNESEKDWKAVLGFSTCPGTMKPAGGLGAAAGGLAGYAMLWPVVLVTAIVSSLAGGGDGLGNPIKQFLAFGASDTDRIILVFSAAIVAPIFEETLFRGFFYRRLRGTLTPYGAAAVSGFAFAAAHLSATGFLQVWAIGFALGLAYEQTGRLRSSMIAHGLWNLGTMLSTIFLFG